MINATKNTLHDHYVKLGQRAAAKRWQYRQQLLKELELAIDKDYQFNTWPTKHLVVLVELFGLEIDE